MKSFLVIFMSFASIFLTCAPVMAQWHNCYSFDGKSSAATRFLENIHQILADQGNSGQGFPKFGKTSLDGDLNGANHLKAQPAIPAELADAIMLDPVKFVPFRVWGFNTRVQALSDFVYFMDEPDRDAIDNGLVGLRSHKYLEIDYSYLINNAVDAPSDELAQTQKIVDLIREGILAAGAKPASCIMKK